MSQNTRMKTVLVKGAVKPTYASLLYKELKDEIKWTDGIYSRKYGGSTRRACMMSPSHPHFNDLIKIIDSVLPKLTKNKYTILGLYLNYYEDGKMFTPSHSHKGTHQIVLSLGATRTLRVGSTDHKMESGDVIIFGSSAHGVPKDESVKDGRISIATFMVKCDEV